MVCAFAFTATHQGAASPRPVLLIYGDSLSAGYRLGSQNGFAPQLAKVLEEKGWDVEIRNASLSGETSAGGLERLAWTLADLPKNAPLAAILELGANDALRGQNPRRTERNLDAMIARMKEMGIEVLLAGMRAPRNLGSRYRGYFDGIYPRLAEKHDILLYPFFLEGVALNPSLNLLDGFIRTKRAWRGLFRGFFPMWKGFCAARQSKRSAKIAAGFGRFFRGGVMPMEYRPLGRSDIKVSSVCLGTMTWGQQNSEAEGHAQMDRALEAGVNFFDASEMYPIPPQAETHGRTEEIIGTWFQSRKKRGDVILATKVAGRSSRLPWLREDGGRIEQSRAQIMEALEGSLRRLQTDYVDLYQLHWPDRPMNLFGGALGYQHREGESHAIGEILETLAACVESGEGSAYRIVQ